MARRSQPPMMGCHQPSERFKGTIIPFAWFAKGDADPGHRRSSLPREVAYYEADAPQGFTLAFIQ